MIEVRKFDDVCQIVFDYEDLQYNYPLAEILLNKKSAQVLSKKLKEAGF